MSSTLPEDILTFLRRLVTIRLNILFRSFSDIFTTIFPNVDHAHVDEIASGLVGRVFDTYLAEIAQLVERRTENPGVPSSILGLGIFFIVPNTGLSARRLSTSI